MHYVLTAAEMQELDRVTIEELGLPGAVLMENAGRAVARAVLRELGDRAEAARVAVVCGGGNNGGDGFVVARWLREWGLAATAYLAAAPDRLRGDAALHFAVYDRVGGVVASIADATALAEHRRAIQAADAVVDAVFGTGLAREVTGHYREVIEVMNGCTGRRIAVDVPSGLSADTGEPLGLAFRAELTVTIAFRKVGLTAQAGFATAGRVEVAEIGIPRALAEAHGIRLGLLEAADVASAVPRHEPSDHKNRRGHVLVVAGSPGKRGAGRLCAWAALRAGAGLSTLASPWASAEVWAPDPIMTEELDPDTPGALERLAGLAERVQVIAMGPGMPTSAAARELVRKAVAELEVPLVLDADALNHLAPDLELVATCAAPVVLTPHPGEAARLLDISSSEVQRDRVAAARRLAETTRAAVVLKGARSLVCDGLAGDGVVTINPTGGPALATAGSGDVLTGVIAALIGQGVAPGEAARLGCYLHGLAADRAAAELGPWSVTASDVLEALPGALLETT
jgi:ADP-dependent NAD(P)H-hydrate dehydratase / NAD(P)H-hydrate epimerase